MAADRRPLAVLDPASVRCARLRLEGAAAVIVIDHTSAPTVPTIFSLLVPA